MTFIDQILDKLSQELGIPVDHIEYNPETKVLNVEGKIIQIQIIDPPSLLLPIIENEIKN